MIYVGLTTYCFIRSFAAGAAGLNLMVANHCFLMDPAMNSAVEEQAIDRWVNVGTSLEEDMSWTFHLIKITFICLESIALDRHGPSLSNDLLSRTASKNISSSHVGPSQLIGQARPRTWMGQVYWTLMILKRREVKSVIDSMMRVIWVSRDSIGFISWSCYLGALPKSKRMYSFEY